MNNKLIDFEEEEKVRFHWQMSESNERYTPPEIVDVARKTFGGIIDVDPASNPVANTWIGAKKFFTKEDEGLGQFWFGNVWLNPPYGKIGRKSSVDVWAKALGRKLYNQETEQACFLIGSRHLNLEYVQHLADGRVGPAAILFPRERIKYLRIPGNKVGNLDNAGQLEVMPDPPGNNALIYVGPNVGKFFFHAQELGFVTVPFKMIPKYPKAFVDAIVQVTRAEQDQMIQSRIFKDS